MVSNTGFFKLLSGQYYDENLANKYYRLMLELSLKCIIFHELGHIFNGHIDYLKASSGNDVKLYEIEYNTNQSNSFSKISAINWQAMEWNADDFASTRIIGQATYKDIIENTIIENKEHGLWLAAISQVAAYSLMYIGIKNRSEADYKLKKHLPLRFRLESLIKNILYAYEKFNGDNLLAKFELYMKAMTRVEEWCNLFIKEEHNITQDIDTKNNIDELDVSHRRYYKIVEQYYIYNLSYDLKNYTHMKVIENI